ncbi:MAG: hypothetical protein ACOYXY_11150 [Thermodesulfobacteriota bacterium]
MKGKAVVKIDLCGSKEYVDKHKDADPQIRVKLLNQLQEYARGVFPEADKPYPDGSMHSAQGDAIFLILERPTVALRCAIEFMKGWHGKVPSLPDCRTIIDYGDVKESSETTRLELVGEPFENIDTIEKHFRAGQIGVTDSVIDNSDNTVVQYVSPRTFDVTSTRQITAYLVNYEDPRLMQYSSLAHALFIADASGTHIRNRAFEALLIEALVEASEDEITTPAFLEWLRSRNLPEPSPDQLDSIIAHSKFVKRPANDRVTYRGHTRTTIRSLQAEFNSAQDGAVKQIASTLATQIGISSEELQRKLNIRSLAEEYLCAVFLEIRMMANYFRSAGTLFEKTSAFNEYDYILKKHLRELSTSTDEFILFKRAFLTALKDLAQQKDKYIAAIFHNVLLLYYLNRNSRLSRGQLSAMRDKQVYLDANAFYALVCNGSSFHSIITFTIERLKKLGSKICLFDRSLHEYLDSLDYTLRKYQKSRHYEFIGGGPWIWREFVTNPTRYRDDFEFCVALHRVPSDCPQSECELFDLAREELKAKDIALHKLDPFVPKEELVSCP